MYRERASTVPGAVVWEKTGVGHDAVLPDGCMDLIWMGGQVVVAGPDTSPHVSLFGGYSNQKDSREDSERFVGLRFPPGALPRLLGVPATELVDARAPLAEVMPGTDALADEIATADAGSALESFARRQTMYTPDARTRTIVQALQAGLPVSTVASQVNLSSRQLHRWSLRNFGYGAKTLARILRFQAALNLASVEPCDAAVAARAGYADQAHLIRETTDLAGCTFAALARA
ncbi:helix-turn-helix domain-containing protein [Allosaccharopolyspora coralli]|uniref:Helix-turn-helix domain-containing protein n=1 Tax=Allosaccharopolyspora coralli TaxID=2665642 RepID=A0A5Q3QDI9_9PSEU|nr:helix-turn-helix domain-containing protein [Allosaccharopolyspora coralli]QGK68837.1 helix-turn-helix domain-containing protein [Allosaccharopolyspora coralli]